MHIATKWPLRTFKKVLFNKVKHESKWVLKVDMESMIKLQENIWHANKL